MAQVGWFPSAGGLNLDASRRWIHQGTGLVGGESIRMVRLSLRAWTNQVPDPGSVTPNFNTVLIGVTIGDDVGSIPPQNPAVSPGNRDWLAIWPVRWNVMRRAVTSAADVSTYEMTTYGKQEVHCPRQPVPAGRSFWVITSELPTVGSALEWISHVEVAYYSIRP